MILAARTPVLPCRTPLVREAGVEAAEEDVDEDSPPVGEEGLPVSEARGHEGVDEELAELLLPLLQHRLPRRLHRLRRTLLTASPSKGQAPRIPLHHPPGLVRWRLVLEALSWRGTATSVIPWRAMTTHPGIRLFRVQRTVRQGLPRRPLRALTVSSRLLLHERSHDVCETFFGCTSIKQSYFKENYGEYNIWSGCV